MDKKVTLIVPTYNSNVKFLDKTFRSIIDQTYINLEVIIIDDGSKKKDHHSLFTNRDRFKYVYLDENKGIAEATTKGIEIATGEYIGFVDHDDTLKLTCVEECVKYLKDHPEYSMVYTDEEFIDKNDKLIHYTYKEDYNDDLLLSKMYINHFKLIKAATVKEFLPVRFSGAQDYDLILRISEKYKIGHLRRVLYSWRQSKISTTTMGIDDRVFANSKTVVEETMKRRGIKGSIKASIIKTHWHIDRTIETTEPVSIIILTKDQPTLLRNCISSIEHNADYPHEVIIVDTGSTNTEALNIINTTYHTVLHDTFHFSKTNNKTVTKANFKYLLFLNNDTIATPYFLSEMVKHIQRPEVGIVGSRLIYANKTIQHAGVALGLGGIAGHIHLNAQVSFPHVNYIREVSSVTGACLMIKREIFEQVGGFDPEYMIEFQDVDLCMKVKKLGYKIIYTPYSTLYHVCSATRGEPSREIMLHDRPYFVSKWYKELLEPDINLTEDMKDPNHLPTLEFYHKIAEEKYENINNTTNICSR
jgi:GT2 family glycosyltransferase